MRLVDNILSYKRNNWKFRFALHDNSIRERFLFYQILKSKEYNLCLSCSL